MPEAATLDRSRAARPLVALAMPVMVVANQFLAEHTARAMQGQAFGLGWLARLAGSHWAQAWIGCEAMTFPIWMVVLADLSLSAAFPMTAFGYVLVIVLGWTVFQEPVTALELIGSATILAGVWLLGRGETSA